METLRDKVMRLERLANPLHIREEFHRRTTAAPSTPQDNIISMRQEIYRLREGLNEALSIIEDLIKL